MSELQEKNTGNEELSAWNKIADVVRNLEEDAIQEDERNALMREGREAIRSLEARGAASIE